MAHKLKKHKIVMKKSNILVNEEAFYVYGLGGSILSSCQFFPTSCIDSIKTPASNFVDINKLTVNFLWKQKIP
jgi:hypothetical protein